MPSWPAWGLGVWKEDLQFLATSPSDKGFDNGRSIYPLCPVHLPYWAHAPPSAWESGQGLTSCTCHGEMLLLKVPTPAFLRGPVTSASTPQNYPHPSLDPQL